RICVKDIIGYVSVDIMFIYFFFFSSRRRHTRSYGDWSSDVCSSDLPGRRSVVSETFVQRGTRRLDDVARGVEIRLANFEMNNVSAFCLQRSRLHQDFERSLGAETRHPLGQTKFVSLSHDGEMSIKAR